MSIEPSPAGKERPSQLIDLALQGGGSHGAFTWGVLDRLLEESWLAIEGISGTSAGAMNAAVMVDGHAAGGSRGAREALEAFWRSVSEAAAFSPFQRSPLDVLLGRWTLDHSPAYIAIDLMARLFSPYDLNFGAHQSAAQGPVGDRSTSSALPRRRSSSSSPRPTCAPARPRCSATPSSRPTCCSPRPACRPCSRRSRSTASPIGTAATPAIRP